MDRDNWDRAFPRSHLGVPVSAARWGRVSPGTHRSRVFKWT